MKSYSLIFLASTILLIKSCSYIDYRFCISNNSNYTIVVAPLTDTIYTEQSMNNFGYYEYTSTKPGDEWRIPLPPRRKAWSQFIEASYNNKLNFLIVDIDSLRKYQDWNTLINREICEKYSLSEEELEHLDWKVEYPLFLSDSLNYIPTSKIE